MTLFRTSIILVIVPLCYLLEKEISDNILVETIIIFCFIIYFNNVIRDRTITNNKYSWIARKIIIWAGRDYSLQGLLISLYILDYITVYGIVLFGIICYILFNIAYNIVGPAIDDFLNETYGDKPHWIIVRFYQLLPLLLFGIISYIIEIF